MLSYLLTIAKRVSQKHQLLLTCGSVYFSSDKDKRVKELIYNTFPSFQRRGVMPLWHDGVVLTAFDTPF
jgi:hypothetical protein